MMLSQDKMTQYINFSPHQSFELQDQQPRPNKKQNIFKTNNYNIQWFKLKLSIAQARSRRNVNTLKTCWRRINDERPTGKKQVLDGTTVEK